MQVSVTLDAIVSTHSPMHPARATGYTAAVKYRAIAIIVSLLAAQAKVQAADGNSAKPNIILVMPDDLGYGDYSCLGNPVMKTPTADAFWKQSVRLTDFHVSPTCSPTRSALMTGFLPPFL